ncbi:MAG: metallophosphoesterase [Lautropia sp.]
MARVGVISDTHGLLRPETLAFLAGCDHIVHGGDIGGAELLARLSTIAPVTSVRGNNDYGAWADALPETVRFDLYGVPVYALHDLARLDIEPSAAGIRVVISGHSHKPMVEQREGGVIYVNPGSAGPRRFRLPVAVAELVISRGQVSARIVELLARSAASR